MFLGGVITEYLSWPWVFYLNVPIALIIMAAVPALMPAGGGRRGSVDIVGAVTVTLGLGCELCKAAHTDAGRAAGLTETDIALARDATATDAREAALLI